MLRRCANAECGREFETRNLRRVFCCERCRRTGQNASRRSARAEARQARERTRPMADPWAQLPADEWEAETVWANALLDAVPAGLAENPTRGGDCFGAFFPVRNLRPPLSSSTLLPMRIFPARSRPLPMWPFPMPPLPQFPARKVPGRMFGKGRRITRRFCGRFRLRGMGRARARLRGRRREQRRARRRSAFRPRRRQRLRRQKRRRGRRPPGSGRCCAGTAEPGVCTAPEDIRLPAGSRKPESLRLAEGRRGRLSFYLRHSLCDSRIWYR